MKRQNGDQTMAGLLSGLDKLGLKNIEEMNVFEEALTNEEAPSITQPEQPVVKETDYLFDKTHECPVCFEEIKVRTMKAGKARLLRTDLDLRPIYENIEPLKYDVIECPHCGYTALSRYFKQITSSQIKAIRENIATSFHGSNKKQETYTYEEALERYKLSLANAIVKHAKASEKAYICLKAGWLIRSQIESLALKDTDIKDINQLGKLEKEFLQNALEGFLSARQVESYPMCGMDEVTVEYIVAVLAMQFEQYEISSRIIAEILSSRVVNSRMKDKAREVKDYLIARLREKNSN